jgi:hypothetical protein
VVAHSRQQWAHTEGAGASAVLVFSAANDRLPESAAGALVGEDGADAADAGAGAAS